MKQLQQSIGRWVPYLAGKTQVRVSAQPARRLVELDMRALRKVNGGTGMTPQATPNKGW